MSESIRHPKTLRQRDLVLFTVSAILLPDTLAAVASAGPSSIAWWLILGVLFLLPFGLISAELGCAYPEQGGIYAWVRDAFGGRWASRVTWCYWINMTVWLSAIYILSAGMLNQIFRLNLGLGAQIAIAIAITWATVIVNVVALRIGKWIPNLGALVKFVLFAAIILGALRYVGLHDMANALTLNTMTPRWNEGLQYIPAIIYGMLGFELVSAGSEEMRDPARDVPRAILYAGIAILVLYLLGTVAVLAAIPAADINLVEGLIDTLRMFFSDLAVAGPLVTTLGLATVFAIFSSGVAWALGANRAAGEAALERELPAPFGIENPRNGSPIGAALLMGISASSMLLLYGVLAGSNEDLFWSLFAFSAVLFLLPYVGMVLAFLRLRRKDPTHPRPFRVPGGPLVAHGAAWLCIGILSIAIVLFMYTPGSGAEWAVIAGVIAQLALGEVLIRWGEQHGEALAADI
jgi:amino acid transporter